MGNMTGGYEVGILSEGMTGDMMRGYEGEYERGVRRER